jgi:aspartate aminotransferase-like enzyme
MGIYPSRKLIMLPGPTNVPERVLNAMIKPVINHRGPEFRKLYRSIIEKAKLVFETSGDIVIFSSSGTGGVEASVVNIVRRGDNVVIPTFGEFSGRLAEQITLAGGNAIRVDAPLGSIPTPDEIEEAVRRAGSVKAIYVVYNETSPGATYRQLKEVSDIASKYGAFMIVDAISILGGDELPQDKWNIDIVVAGSQKCLSMPPGLALLGVSERVRRYIQKNPPPTAYFNIVRYIEYGERGETPYTPSIPLFYALEEALEMVLEEGLNNRIRRHRVTAEAFYEGLMSIGLKPFVKPNARSNVVISIEYPSGVDDKTFREELDQKFGVVVAGGFGELRGKIFRIGNMGEVSRYHVLTTLNAIGAVLNLKGFKVDVEKMISIAENKLKALNKE